MIRVLPFNEIFYKDIARLIFQYKDILGDDYIKFDTMEKILVHIELFKHNMYVALENDKFIGFFYFSDVLMGEAGNHSCFITGASCRKVKRQSTREAFRKFIVKLYDDFGFKKIYAKTNIKNLPAKKILQDLKFHYEGRLKGSSMKNGKLTSDLLFGKIQYKYLQKG